MGIRCRNGIYQVIYYPEGGKGKQAYFTLPRGANEAHAREWDKVLSVPDPQIIYETSTLCGIYPDYLDFLKNNRDIKTYKAAESLYKHYIYRLANIPLNKLTPQVINEYKKTLLTQGVGNRTINKTLLCLSGCTRYAIEQLYLNIQPLRYFPLPYTPALPEIMSIDEMRAFLIALKTEPIYFLAFLTVAVTALRKSDVLSLTCEDVNRDRLTILIRKSKRNKPKILPVPEWLIAAYEKINPEWQGFIFKSKREGKKITDLRKAIRRAKTRAEIPESRRIYLHLFRHSISTYLTSEGVSLGLLQNLLDHEDPRTTSIYITLSAQNLRGTVDKMGSQFSDLANGIESIATTSQGPNPANGNKKRRKPSKILI